MRGFNAFLKFIDNWTRKICIVLLAVMTVTIFLQVFFRSVVCRPLSWTEEFSRFLMIWASFIGAGSMIRNWENVGIDYFIEKLPKAIRNPIRVMIKLVVLAFLGYTFYLSMNVFPQVGYFQITPALGIKMIWAQLGVIIGLGLMFLQLLGLIFREPLKGIGGELE